MRLHFDHRKVRIGEPASQPAQSSGTSPCRRPLAVNEQNRCIEVENMTNKVHDLRALHSFPLSAACLPSIATSAHPIIITAWTQPALVIITSEGSSKWSAQWRKIRLTAGRTNRTTPPRIPFLYLWPDSTHRFVCEEDAVRVDERVTHELIYCRALLPKNIVTIIIFNSQPEGKLVSFRR